MKNMNLHSHNNFWVCGLTGWCIEIIFTAVQCIRRHDRTLTGQTSLWMFPIYGMAMIIKPLYRIIWRLPMLARGSIYSVCILTGEYISGSILKKYDCCPWDYSQAKANVRGVIRLDYAPLWMCTGLMYEKILHCTKNG